MKYELFQNLSCPKNLSFPGFGIKKAAKTAKREKSDSLTKPPTRSRRASCAAPQKLRIPAQAGICGYITKKAMPNGTAFSFLT